MLLDDGLEPIAVQGSGGALLTPVQKLAATIIFAPWAKMHIESYIVHHKRTVIVIRSYGSFILLFTPKTGLIEHFSKKMPNLE